MKNRYLVSRSVIVLVSLHFSILICRAQSPYETKANLSSQNDSISYSDTATFLECRLIGSGIVQQKNKTGKWIYTVYEADLIYSIQVDYLNDCTVLFPDKIDQGRSIIIYGDSSIFSLSNNANGFIKRWCEPDKNGYTGFEFNPRNGELKRKAIGTFYEALSFITFSNIQEYITGYLLKRNIVTH